jgi:hypothetical protein
MYVQLKTGHGTDEGPSWISRVRFSKTWRTAYIQGRTLHRVTGFSRANFDSNFYDVDLGDEYWLSGPKSDRTDGRYSSRQPMVEEYSREAYEALLGGALLPGRENG